jgi:TPR repeat protein
MNLHMKILIIFSLMLLSNLANAKEYGDIFDKLIENLKVKMESDQLSNKASDAWRAVKNHSPGALKQLEEVAQSGDPGAQNMMGWLYDNGDYGAPINHRNALAYFKASASQGNAVAIYNIGIMYYYGRGLLQNKESAYQWFVRAAESKNVTRACVRAAVMGMQTDADQLKNASFVQCATDKGSPTGFFLRGKLEFLAGRYDSATQWLTRAANAMEPNAPWFLSRLYSDNKHGIRQDFVMAAGWWQIGTKLNPERERENTIGFASFPLTDEQKLRANKFAEIWMSSHPKSQPINYAKSIIYERE